MKNVMLQLQESDPEEGPPQAAMPASMVLVEEAPVQADSTEAPPPAAATTGDTTQNSQGTPESGLFLGGGWETNTKEIDVE